MKKKLPSNFFMMLVLAAGVVFLAVGIPTYDGQTLLGSIMLIFALLAAIYALYRSGKKKDARRVVGAEVYEDAKTRERNRAHELTTFSVEFQDGSRELRTVRNDSEEYQTYISLGKARQ